MVTGGAGNTKKTVIAHQYC